MSVRRRAVKARVERQRKWDADKAAVDEVLAGIKNDLTLRLAEEACQRVFTGDVVAAGVDFILNCPLGESPTTVKDDP